MAIRAEEEVFFESLCSNACIYLTVASLFRGCRSKNGRWIWLGIGILGISDTGIPCCQECEVPKRYVENNRGQEGTVRLLFTRNTDRKEDFAMRSGNMCRENKIFRELER